MVKEQACVGTGVVGHVTLVFVLVAFLVALCPFVFGAVGFARVAVPNASKSKAWSFTTWDSR